jgi:hypothetical protein
VRRRIAKRVGEPKCLATINELPKADESSVNGWM